MFPWLWILRSPGRLAAERSGDGGVLDSRVLPGHQAGTGVPAVEQQIFDQASYGKQLGWLMDVLIEAINPATLRSPRAQASLVNLKKLDAKAERIKSEHHQDRVDAAIALLDQLRTDSPEELARVLQRYQPARDLLASARP